MLSGFAPPILSSDRRKRKSPKGSLPDRLCVQTRYKVDPGRYSHRNTAFPRKDTKLKSGLEMVIEGAGPDPSESTIKDFVPSGAVDSVSVEFPSPKTSKSYDRGLASSFQVE